MIKHDLIQNPKELRPHVVLLGSGASRAAFPNGDQNNKKLPVMNDLINILDLEDLFQKNGILLLDNFEEIYSNIVNTDLSKELETKIKDYFSDLVLPDIVTDYDRLLLSLRDKDAIFTFNWDPFLFDAYFRNIEIASLPNIFFLHGNVRIGACAEHYEWGKRNGICNICSKVYDKVPLLYPIKKKNYENSNLYTAKTWEAAKQWFRDAFTITIFGYGAPSSDVEAVELIRNAWFDGNNRTMEHVEIIDIADNSVLAKKWGSFTPTHHYTYHQNFRDSRLWRWPRRSCESLIYPITEGIPCETFPVSNGKNLDEFRERIRGIAKYEL